LKHVLLQTALDEIRQLREERQQERIRFEAVEAILQQRDEELRRLEQRISTHENSQLSPSNYGARGDLISRRDRENLRETPIRAELGYKLKPDVRRNSVVQRIFFPI